MTSYDYDLFVIGGGSGGVRAARLAAAAGMKVGLAEAERLGGTCVNQGCVPKKLYFYSSQFNEAFTDSLSYGWELSQPKFSWQVLQKNKDQEISRLNKVYERLLQENGVRLFFAHAKITGEHSVELREGSKTSSKKTITSEKILIATGAKPFVPDFVGKEHVVTSDAIFAQQKLPKQVIIVGGGYIAVEFAGIFSNLGCSTTLIYRGELFLRRFDDSIRHSIAEQVQEKGVRLHFQTEIVSIHKERDETLRIQLNNGRILTADQVVYATGRVANVDKLGLQEADIALDKKGNIQVDNNFCTNVSSIYALGDVIGRHQLTPVALAEAKHFVRTQFERVKLAPLDYENIPTAVFSQPTVATVGLTEQQAKEKYKHVRTYQSHFRALKHSLGDNMEKNLIKLVIDDETDRLLGLHLVGNAEAAETIQGMAPALRAGITKTMLDQTIGVHPTVAEELFSLK